MSATLIARNRDLQRLQEEGYSLQIVRGTGLHLLVHDVPYVNADRLVKRGTLVAPLEVNGEATINPVPNHQTWFMGEHPCEADGTRITGIMHGSERQDFGDGVVVDHSFSAKPRGGQSYPDNYEKFHRYITLLSAPAQMLESGITARVHRTIASEDGASVFHYADTSTSRARIGAVAQKLASYRVAIVGIGGTGSYLLDFLAKTPVAEIHLFDGDRFLQHNAFRAPGAPSLEELTAPMKVDYFAGIYSRMRRAIVPHPVYVDEQVAAELTVFDFVFVCVDRGAARRLISQALIAAKRPFIDVGMEVHSVPGDRLGGQCRTTLVTAEKQDHFADRATLADAPGNDLYAANAQLAELNALNASMALLRWKRFVGFFGDDMGEHHAIYTVSTNAVSRSDAL